MADGTGATVPFDLGPAPAPPAHLGAYEIREVSAVLAARMVAQWHSLLPYIDPTNICRSPPYACYGLLGGGQFYAVAVYSAPVARRLADGATLELRRLAIAAGTPRNTATWMMARCERQLRRRFPGVSRLVSYQDTERHAGTIYRAGGWLATARVRYRPWAARKTGPRSAPQSTAAKVRWEKTL